MSKTETEDRQSPKAVVYWTYDRSGRPRYAEKTFASQGALERWAEKMEQKDNWGGIDRYER